MENNRILKRLPTGIQTFETLVEENCLYVDKTERIYKMLHYSKYVSLSRPRLFGKPLLISIFQNYFEGKRELFKGVKTFSRKSAANCSNMNRFT